MGRPASKTTLRPVDVYLNTVFPNHYGENAKRGDTVSEPLIDRFKCSEEWSLAKKIVIERMYPRDSTKVWWKLLFDFHEDILPNMLVLGKLALIMPRLPIVSVVSAARTA